MALSTGTRIGPFEIQSALGAGGMGEVYRARDTSLNRDVAIKVLLPAVASDPERLTRFTREAHVLASLNHPNIAAIYGLESSQPSAGPCLVMEFVDGPTLADRIARGAIPTDEALPIARQIAEALEAAHEQGIIHRDLKPANIKVRPDGTVKVLDFGLAKAVEGAGEAGRAGGAAGLSNSPTITSPAMTHAGMILGTAAYMSPEQAAGKLVDRRSDLWSFGVVLLEMLTGRPVFAGETVAHVLASVLKSEPDWSRLPADTPGSIRRLLRRCLEKERKQRLADASVARLEIQDAISRVPDTTLVTPVASSAGTRRRRSMALAGALLAVVAGVAAAAIAFGKKTPPPDPPLPYRLQVLAPATVRFDDQVNGNGVISPDGRYLVFVARATGANRLWVRSLDSLDARALDGTDDATNPFWSPDSKTVGFVARDEIKRVDIVGGPVTTIARASAIGSGLSWGADGTILFGSLSGSLDGAPLRRVAAAGGPIESVTKIDVANRERGHSYPVWLPDGRHFLYRAQGSNSEERGVYVGSPGAADRKLVIANGSNVAYAGGYLLFLRDTTLMAQPFDLASFELGGAAVPIAEHILVAGASGRTGAFSVSNNGVLAYRTGTSTVRRSRLLWMDRDGKQRAAVGPPGMYRNPRLSPDGTQIAVDFDDGRNRDIWVMDAQRGVPRRLTSDPAVDVNPVWSADGRQIGFTRNPNSARPTVLARAASGIGEERRIVELPGSGTFFAWLPDDNVLATLRNGTAASSIWKLPLTQGATGTAITSPSFNTRPARFSPDGRWMAYSSNESGSFEVYIRDYPNATTIQRVSKAGGDQPEWAKDGKALFYLAADDVLMTVPLTWTAAGPRIGEPERLFAISVQTGGYAQHEYDVDSTGRRFLVNQLEPDAPNEDPFVILVNWASVLRR